MLQRVLSGRLKSLFFKYNKHYLELYFKIINLVLFV